MDSDTTSDTTTDTTRDLKDPFRLDDVLHAQLDRTLAHTDFPGLGERHEGKVRDSYVRGNERIIVVTDRLSAFDRIIGTIPFKGQVLNQIARYWFEETAHIAPNHVLRIPDPNVMVVRECTPLRAEMVVRAYLTGVTDTSIWRAYERGERTFCGHALPEGMKKNQKLPAPLLTPSTKAPKGEHDVSVSGAELVAMGAVTAEHFARASEIAMALFAFGQRRAAARGLILVDTKYEMGVTPEGEVIVIDEIHTPDSSRYWYAEDFDARVATGQEPRSLDKEYVRRWLAEEAGYRGDGPPPTLPDHVRVEAARRYIATYELVTGRAFVPDPADPQRRIPENLGLS
jgi:phosphoribosylaminoimidazole-succinocarboxamide synthase